MYYGLLSLVEGDLSTHVASEHGIWEMVTARCSVRSMQTATNDDDGDDDSRGGCKLRC